MNKIEQLLEKYCPDGVEFKELWKVCEVANNKRKPIRADLRIPWETPYYWANNVQDYVEWFTHDGNYVLIAEDGSSDLNNYSIQFTSGKFWANNHVHVISGLDFLNTKFLFYYLKNMNFLPFLSWLPRAKLTRTKMVSIPIPIPPIEVQQEIVKILDTFTQLEAELEAELEARKKQYEYYRGEMLSFEDDEVEWKELGDFAEIWTGRHDTRDAIIDWDYTFYARGKDPLKLNTFDFNETAIITAWDWAGVGKVYHWVEGKYALHQRAYRIVPNSELNPRYAYHYLVTKFYFYICKASVSSSVTSLRRPMFLKFPIQIPSLQKQQEIVDVLDKFDALVNDISSGLPAEIKARKQQYEYYREKLLTFKRLEK